MPALLNSLNACAENKRCQSYRLCNQSALRDIILRTSAASRVKKVRGTWSCKFPTKEIIGVQNFNLFQIFLKMEVFLRKLCFLAKNLRQEKNFPTAQNFGWGRAIVPLLPPCHDATGGRDISTVHDCQLLLHFKFAKQTT